MLCIEKELGKYSWRSKMEQTEEEKPKSHAANVWDDVRLSVSLVRKKP